jgi:hypothetical protein
MMGRITLDNAIAMQSHNVSMYGKEEITRVILEAVVRSLSARQHRRFGKLSVYVRNVSTSCI